MWEEKRGKKEKCLKLFLAYKDTGDFIFFICHLQMYLDKKQNASILI